METLKAMGALISKEADSMSALTFRMNKADKAQWVDMKFYAAIIIIIESAAKLTKMTRARRVFSDRSSACATRHATCALVGLSSSSPRPS